LEEHTKLIFHFRLKPEAYIHTTCGRLQYKTIYHLDAPNKTIVCELKLKVDCTEIHSLQL
jgi:hypothetical protein